jgi:hypothetical protein
MLGCRHEVGATSQAAPVSEDVICVENGTTVPAPPYALIAYQAPFVTGHNRNFFVRGSEYWHLKSFFPGAGETHPPQTAFAGAMTDAIITFHAADGSTLSVRVSDGFAMWSDHTGEFGFPRDSFRKYFEELTKLKID